VVSRCCFFSEVKVIKRNKLAKFGILVSILSGILYSGLVLADDSGIGGIATQVTGEFSSLGKLIMAVAFLAGIGFVMASMFKFKQHKDMPQQNPLGVPITHLVLGAFLIFMPSLIAPAGYSIFKDAKPGGFTGSGVTNIPGGSG
jgi:intracellular multiplication protein IcmD